MQARIFYESDASQAIPLFLVSQKEWLEKRLNLTELELSYCHTQNFKANLNEFCVIYNQDAIIEKVFVGCGEGRYEHAMASAALQLPATTYQLQSQVSEEALLFWSLAQYRYDEFKSSQLAARRLVLENRDLRSVLLLADAHFLVRDLVNKPASIMGPSEMALVVAALANEYNAEFSQWIGDELLAANFPGVYAVGRAAVNEPRMLSLEWGELVHPKVTLIGKGVCFDTGGLDIKSAYGMRTMKKDMGGAAHVIGLAKWIMSTNLPVRLQVLIPAVENAIGPNAFRPGDVMTLRNGNSVEIHNTDAEGRLVLADALALACEQLPDLLIDFATLTGAARVSVGTELSALFSNNNDLAQRVIECAQETCDPIWQLPLYKPYEDYLKSSIADMANASDHPYAGAIIASLFLQRFINPKVDWLHLDIMAWTDKSRPGKPEGGEAMGLRAIARYLTKRYA